MDVIDPQARGWRDDGSESGLQRFEPTRLHLVRVPMHNTSYASENVGGTLAFQRYHAENPDGSCTALYMATAITTAGTSAGVRVSFPFYGPVFGLRFPRADASVLSTLAAVSLAIDGVAYPINVHHDYMDAEGWTYVDLECCYIVATDLGDGVHYADIILPASSTVAQGFWLYGYLVDASAGYQTPRAGICIINTNTLTTSYAAVSTTQEQSAGGTWSWSTNAFAARMRFIEYVNTSAGAVNVSLQHNSKTIWSAALAVGASARWDPGELIPNDSLYQHKCDTASAVNASVYGGY